MIDRRALLLSSLALAACGPRTSAPGLAAPAGTLPTNRANFSDADPVDWPGLRPESFAVHGIDISRWQEGIDWPRARDAGVSFVFMKATEGGDLRDPRIVEHWNEAAAAGVPAGAYHFWYHCTPARTQAEWFIANVPRLPGALPPVLDMEWTPFSPTCTVRPPAAEVRGRMEEFLTIVTRHYGTRPIVYTTPDFYDDMGFANVTGEDFWLRATATDPTSRYRRSDWRFWQYSGTGLVPGIQGEVDLNVFNGSAALWRQWVAARAQR